MDPRPLLIPLDDEFFDDLDAPPEEDGDSDYVVVKDDPQGFVPDYEPEHYEPGPAYVDLGFTVDEIPLLGPPSKRTPRGWAYRVNKVLTKAGKTLLDTEGRLLFSRAEFLLFSREVLRTLASYELPVDVARIPWGAFAGEVASDDREADWERLRAWLDER